VRSSQLSARGSRIVLTLLAISPMAEASMRRSARASSTAPACRRRRRTQPTHFGAHLFGEPGGEIEAFEIVVKALFDGAGALSPRPAHLR
jgi:hypothetical protein